MKRNLVFAMIVSVVIGAGSVVTAKPLLGRQESEQEAKLVRQARVTKEQAQETALKRAPGNVESAELEREHGRLVYSFDIRNARGTIDEVQVSAITGRVVRVEHETRKQEAAEKRNEAKEKKH